MNNSPSLDELIAINREIAALARSGIPLELGLRSFAGGLQSRLSRLANRIADRLSEGQPLAMAIQLEGSKEYPVYSAVISAGLQSGQLSEALESVATSAELVQDLRKRISLSLIYPFVICVIGYSLFCLFVSQIVPRYVWMADDFGFGNETLFRFLNQLHATQPIWGWGIPALFLVLVALRMFFWRRGPARTSLTLGSLLSRARFADLLQIQVARGLPLGPSFQRAAIGSGDRRLCLAADSISRDMEHGVSFSEAVAKVEVIPPVMRWMLATGAKQGTLAKTLGLMRDSWQRRANRRARSLKVWLPAFVTCIIGGTVTMVYGILFFLPLRAVWEGVMRE